jgi:hypothetical protein
MPNRSFVDAEGRSWNAWDVLPAEHADWPQNARKHLPGVMASGWLCFESEAGKRRIHPIPRGWERWSDDELRVRCALALPVARRAS